MLDGTINDLAQSITVTLRSLISGREDHVGRVKLPMSNEARLNFGKVIDEATPLGADYLYSCT